VAGRLAFAIDPVPVRAGMADEILERADDADAPPGVRASHGLRPGLGRRLVLATAAALLLVAGGVGGFLAGNQGRQPADVQALAAFLSQEATRVAHFSGSGSGNLSLAFQPGRRSGFLFASGLAPAPEGRVYELWTFPAGGPPVPSGTFVAKGDVLVLHIPADLSRARMMAVTVERSPGASQPTTKPIFTAPVTV
jgi:anti-sigma-K factor RskA